MAAVVEETGEEAHRCPRANMKAKDRIWNRGKVEAEI